LTASSTLRSSVEIYAPPERVWRFLLQLADRYGEWHPDHVSARWLGRPNEVGSVLEAVERIAGHEEKLRFELDSLEPPHRYSYRLRGPISALLPRGDFQVDPLDGGSRFVATIQVRLGRLMEILVRKRAAALRAHMREEGESLKRIVESEGRVGTPEPPR